MRFGARLKLKKIIFCRDCKSLVDLLGFCNFEPVKILFLTRQKSVAGSAYSINYLANGLAEKGHETWVGGRPGAFVLRLAERFPAVRKMTFDFKGYTDWKTARSIAVFVKKNSIDLVNAQSGQDRVMVILASMLFGMKARVVFTRRQRPRDEPWLKRWLHLQVASKIVVISHGLKQLFRNKGYREQDLHVIYNGLPDDLPSRVDPQKVKTLRSHYEIPAHHKVVGCVSRLKEQHQLIRAASFLPEHTTLLFVGIQRSDLQEVIDQEKPRQHLVFTASKDHDEVLNHYKLMDVNVLASKMDGFGLTLVEAMALGVPVIGSNFGGIPDVIGEDENGLLFDNGDIAAFGDKINRILTDEQLRSRLVANGKKAYLEKFALKQTVAAYEQFFSQL